MCKSFVNYVKLCLNKCVFNLVLKVSTVDAPFNSSGNLFHSSAPATTKARSPYDVVRVLGVSSLLRKLLLELKFIL